MAPRTNGSLLQGQSIVDLNTAQAPAPAPAPAAEDDAAPAPGQRRHTLEQLQRLESAMEAAGIQEADGEQGEPSSRLHVLEAAWDAFHKAEAQELQLRVHYAGAVVSSEHLAPTDGEPPLAPLPRLIRC